MTAALRDRIARGGERRRVTLAVEFRRRRGEIETPEPVAEVRPPWLRRITAKDLTEVQS